MIGSTAPLSVWGKFSVGCYSSWVPVDPVCLAVIGGPGHVDKTGYYSQEKLLGIVFSRLNKNPD